MKAIRLLTFCFFLFLGIISCRKDNQPQAIQSAESNYFIKCKLDGIEVTFDTLASVYLLESSTGVWCLQGYRGNIPPGADVYSENIRPFLSDYLKITLFFPDSTPVIGYFPDVRAQGLTGSMTTLMKFRGVRPGSEFDMFGTQNNYHGAASSINVLEVNDTIIAGNFAALVYPPDIADSSEHYNISDGTFRLRIPR